MVFSSVFSIIVGAGMIGQWYMSFRQGQIPELKSEPIRIWFHIAAEMVTAVALLVGGIGLLINTKWSVQLYTVATGMLLYTAIVSPGYFAQKGQRAWLAFFGLIFVCAIMGLFFVYRRTV